MSVKIARVFVSNLKRERVLCSCVLSPGWRNMCLTIFITWGRLWQWMPVILLSLKGNLVKQLCVCGCPRAAERYDIHGYLIFPSNIRSRAVVSGTMLRDRPQQYLPSSKFQLGSINVVQSVYSTNLSRSSHFTPRATNTKSHQLQLATSKWVCLGFDSRISMMYEYVTITEQAIYTCCPGQSPVWANSSYTTTLVYGVITL